MFKQLLQNLKGKIGNVFRKTSLKMGSGMTFGDALRSVKSKMGAVGKPIKRFTDKGEKIVGERIYNTLDGGLVHIGKNNYNRFEVKRYLGENVSNSLYKNTIEGTTASLNVNRGISINGKGKLRYNRTVENETFAALSNEKTLVKSGLDFRDPLAVRQEMQGAITVAPTVSKYTHKVKTITPEKAHSMGLKI